MLDIEQIGRINKCINLGHYGVTSSGEQFKAYLNASTLYAKALADGYPINLSLTNNVITIGQHTNSYEAALIADYLRLLLLANGDTFTFETVMSHPAKLDTFKTAQERGYKNYLYFISTEPEREGTL